MMVTPDAKQEIAEVLVRYATAIDRRDWRLFRTCFTPDVQAEYGDIGAWDSADALAEYMARTHAPMGHTMHRLTNLEISVDDDAATARSYVDVILMSADEQTGLNAVGFYDDAFRCTVEGWQIARRRFTMVHQQAIRASRALGRNQT
jgi:3-phenylpropionate/cinnamic acid dioxygenase small subunit